MLLWVTLLFLHVLGRRGKLSQHENYGDLLHLYTFSGDLKFRTYSFYFILLMLK